MRYDKRFLQALSLIRRRSLDALIVAKRENISYLTGTSGEDSLLILSSKGRTLVTDPRYGETYKKSIKSGTIEIAKNTDEFHSAIRKILKRARSKKVGFESSSVSYSAYSDLRANLNGIKLIPVKKPIEEIRAVKEKREISRIKKACSDASKVMDYAISEITPGRTEISFKKRIEKHLFEKDLGTPPFDVIVASGKTAAAPHAKSSNKKIKPGEMVVIDLGTTNYGYNSDLTRTVFLGRIDREYQALYNIVKTAQRKAIDSIKPGVKASYIDNISREYISKKGYGKNFIHSLGHGIGMEIHEEPTISPKNDIKIKENMVFTIEPGIYVRGWGGIRIEDVVLVTSRGAITLTKTGIRQ